MFVVPFADREKPSREDALEAIHTLCRVKDYETIVYPQVRAYVSWVMGDEPPIGSNERRWFESDLNDAFDSLDAAVPQEVPADASR